MASVVVEVFLSGLYFFLYEPNTIILFIEYYYEMPHESLTKKCLEIPTAKQKQNTI